MSLDRALAMSLESRTFYKCPACKSFKEARHFQEVIAEDMNNVHNLYCVDLSISIY